MINLPDGLLNVCTVFSIQTTARGKGSKIDEKPSQTQSMLNQIVERLSKELRKAASVETAKVQTQV